MHVLYRPSTHPLHFAGKFSDKKLSPLEVALQGLQTAVDNDHIAQVKTADLQTVRAAIRDNESIPASILKFYQENLDAEGNAAPKKIMGELLQEFYQKPHFVPEKIRQFMAYAPFSLKEQLSAKAWGVTYTLAQANIKTEPDAKKLEKLTQKLEQLSQETLKEKLNDFKRGTLSPGDAEAWLGLLDFALASLTEKTAFQESLKQASLAVKEKQPKSLPTVPKSINTTNRITTPSSPPVQTQPFNTKGSKNVPNLSSSNLQATLWEITVKHPPEPPVQATPELTKKIDKLKGRLSRVDSFQQHRSAIQNLVTQWLNIPDIEEEEFLGYPFQGKTQCFLELCTLPEALGSELASSPQILENRNELLKLIQETLGNAQQLSEIKKNYLKQILIHMCDRQRLEKGLPLVSLYTPQDLKKASAYVKQQKICLMQKNDAHKFLYGLHL